MAVNEVSRRQHAVTVLPINKNNSAQTPLTDFIMSMESPTWVPILQRTTGNSLICLAVDDQPPPQNEMSRNFRYSSQNAKGRWTGKLLHSLILGTILCRR
jgi:hypothetical protein